MSQELIPASAPELENEALTLVGQARQLSVTTQESYDAACEFTKGVKALQQKAEAHHRPVIDSAHRTHKAALAALASINEPLVQAEALVKEKIGIYTVEQERIRREANERLEAEQRRLQIEALEAHERARKQAEAEAAAINDAAMKRAEEELETAARLAEAQGATPAEVAAILTTPLNPPVVEPAPAYYEEPRYVPPPRKPPGFERAQGVSTREIWSGQVLDMRELCGAVWRGEVSTNLVQPNMAAINAIARVERQGLKVPGLRAVVATSVAVGGK